MPTLDLTLSTKQANNISIPVNIPNGWTPQVIFRNAVAPTNSFSGGVLNIVIPAADALKYDGIDFFVVATNSGITSRFLHGEFNTPVEKDRVAKISDITSAIGAGGGGGVDPTPAINAAIASEVTRANAAYGAKADVTANTNVITNLPNNYQQAFPATSNITYNGNGDVTSVTEGGITTTYTYNANGTVSTETRNGKVRTWSYDANGNPTGSVVA